MLHFFVLWDKSNIFVRMDNNYNSPELGSIFLIEERENEVVDVDEDRLLEADQSNISIYRIVFYAELFFFFKIFVKNGSASCLLCSRFNL